MAESNMNITEFVEWANKNFSHIQIKDRTVHHLVDSKVLPNAILDKDDRYARGVTGFYCQDHRLFYEAYAILKKVDIVYMTRIQQERFSDPIEYEKVKNAYILSKEMLDGTRKNLKILHPLPRVNEISEDVDDTRQAYYFTQALNGVFVRQALLTSILGVK